MEQNSRTRLTTAGILLLVFASGSLVGMAFDRGSDIAAAETPAGVLDEGGSATDGAATETSSENRGRMIDRIDLSAAQQESVDAIIEAHRSQMDGLNEEFRTTYYPRYYDIVDATRGLIMGELTAEQAATYQDLLSEWDSGHPRGDREELPFRRRN